MIDIIIETGQRYAAEFSQYSKEFPIIAGSVSLWLLGFMASFREYPKKVWEAIVKQSTTTITITSTQYAYHSMVKWFQSKGLSKKCRSIKLNSGRWGEDAESVKSIGYGSHIFWHNCLPIKINVEQQETQSHRERDAITMTVLGRSHDVFDRMIKEAEQLEKGIGVKLNRYVDGYWEDLGTQRPRPLSSVHIERHLKVEILTHVQRFTAGREWHAEQHLPYQTGILLSGPPGTGKTSIIKAIASEINYEINILNTSKLMYIESAFQKLPKKSLIVIEDVDTEEAMHQRNESPPETTGRGGQQEGNNNNDNKLTFVSLADVLNTIDGLVEGDGRILILTTNRPDKIDKALIRAGRIDLHVRLGYATEETVRMFFNSFYKGYTVPADFKIKTEVSPADIQRTILENIDNPENVINKLRGEINE
jgi:chaperone BCS1